jgi:hypothetical protein
MSSVSFCVPENVLTAGVSLPDCKHVEPGRVVNDLQITDLLAACTFQLYEKYVAKRRNN